MQRELIVKRGYVSQPLNANVLLRVDCELRDRRQRASLTRRAGDLDPFRRFCADLAASSSLEVLSLSKYYFSDEHYFLLVEALVRNTSLRSLFLYCEWRVRFICVRARFGARALVVDGVCARAVGSATVEVAQSFAGYIAGNTTLTSLSIDSFSESVSSWQSWFVCA